MKPMPATPTRHNKKRYASRYSLKSVGLGWRMERTSWPFSVLKPVATHKGGHLIFFTSSCRGWLCSTLRTINLWRLMISVFRDCLPCFTCSDYNRLHQLSSVEARLDDVRPTEQGVSFMLLHIEAPGRLLAWTGQTCLGNWHALSWRWTED